MPDRQVLFHQRAARDTQQRAANHANPQKHRLHVEVRALAFFPPKCLQVFGRILFGREHGPKHRQEEHRRAQLESILNRQRHSIGSISCHAEAAKNFRQRIGHRGADADEKTLHHETHRALVRGQLVRHKGAERFHAYVDGSIQHPEHRGCNPDHGRVGHEK